MPRSTGTRTGSDPFNFTPLPVTGGATPPFNLNAPPHTGQGPFGLVPGAIGLPPVYNDVAGVFPNLSGNLGALSKSISSELAGELDPNTIAQLQNTAAQFGIGAGTPLSPFAGSSGLRHLGLTAESQKSKGIEHLLASLPTVAKTLTVSPETQLDVADRNSKYNAAPDPAAAAAEAQRLFREYLALTARVGGGGTMGGGGGGGGAPRNLNTPNYATTPWADFSGDRSASGSQAYVPPFAGSGINWGTQGASPKNLWGGDQGPELGLWGNGAGGGDNSADYWSDWLWGGSDFPGAGGGQPDYPDWDY